MEEFPMQVVAGRLPRRSSATFAPIVTAMIYHTDLASLHRSLKLEKHKDEAVKKRKERLEHNEMKSTLGKPTLGYFALVQQNAILDHFRQCSNNDKIYSIPTDAAPVIESLSGLLAQNATVPGLAKRHCRLPVGTEDDVLEDLALVPYRELVPERQYFRVAYEGIGRKKFVKTAPGAGQRLRRNDIAIDLLRPSCGSTPGNPVFDMGCSAHTETYILRSIGDPEILRDGSQQMTPLLCYSFAGLPSLECPEPAPTEWVTTLVNAKALPESPVSDWVVVAAHQSAMVQCLERASLVQTVEHNLLLAADMRHLGRWLGKPSVSEVMGHNCSRTCVRASPPSRFG